MPSALPIRHKIRGARIGKPAGTVNKLATLSFAGKPDFENDAMALFSLIFTCVPDGTVRELIRLFDEKLSSISRISHKLPTTAPANVSWSQLEGFPPRISDASSKPHDVAPDPWGSSSSSDPP